MNDFKLGLTTNVSTLHDYPVNSPGQVPYRVRVISSFINSDLYILYAFKLSFSLFLNQWEHFTVIILFVSEAPLHTT